MSTILHFRKELVRPPESLVVPGVCVRTMQVPADVPGWLGLRDRATAELTPRPRPWAAKDWTSEMLGKPWWRDDRAWVAIAGELRLAGAESPATRRSPARGEEASEEPVGAVTLALREGAAGTVPIIHWLIVDPAWRRRGVGRLLIFYLERAAWDAGWRQVELETHAGWSAAVAFYQSIGYAPLRERSPR